MGAFWRLTRLRLLDVLRSRSSAGFLLVFPLVLLGVVGLVFRDGHPFERKTLLIVAPESETESERIRGALSSFEEVRVEISASEREALGKLRAKMASAALIRSLDRQAPYRLVVGPRDRLFGRGLVYALPIANRLEVLEAPRAGYVHYLFPGILTFSVMLSGLFATGYTLVLYRQNRFLKKLATTPLPKSSFVAAQVSARSLLVLAQVALLVIAAWVGFGLSVELAALGWLFAITTLGLLAFMGIGFVLACLIKSEDLVVDVISAVNLPLVFLSEIFFPLDALPRPLAVVGELLPSTEMVRLLRSVLLYGDSRAASLGSGLAGLALWTAASFALSLAVFKWHE